MQGYPGCDHTPQVFGTTAVPTAEALEDLALTVRRLEQAGADDDEMPPAELSLDSFELGAVVRHTKHGEGLVISHTEGKVRVDFGGGNAHAYAPQSLHKLELITITEDADGEGGEGSEGGGAHQQSEAELLAERLCGALPEVRESAEDMVNRALSIRREKQGPHHLQATHCLLEAAAILCTRAVTLCTRAATLCTRAATLCILQVGYCLLKVAELHWSRTEYREVSPMHALAPPVSFTP